MNITIFDLSSDQLCHFNDKEKYILPNFLIRMRRWSH